MKRIAKIKEVANGLSVGKHVVEIVGVARQKSTTEGKSWKDTTNQLEVTFENATGRIKAWMNLDGFKNKSDFADGIAPKGFKFESFDETSEKFLVKISTGHRVKSEERTEKLMENIDNLAACAGLEDYDTDTLASELIGAKVGICVKENDRGKNEVSYICEASKVSVEVED